MRDLQPTESDARAYERHREVTRRRIRELARAGQDIGSIPPIKNPDRRRAAERSLRVFCETYFPKIFYLPWSPDHLRVLSKTQHAITHGGTFGVAMPRGDGKTSICETGTMWAQLCIHHPFVMLIGGTKDLALGSIENLKTQYETNDLLLEDFPEVIFPIRCLESETRRCAGQRLYGDLTHIGWTSDEIVLPTIAGSASSGSIVRVVGLEGNIRGAKYNRRDGTSVRPTLAIVDDPQTDESARSISQTRQRINLINGAILGLAGPGRRIAVIMPCTVIRRDDVADQLLDHDRNPQWHGERTKLVDAFPTNETLWAQYQKIRHDEAQRNTEAANAFYIANREAMDEGARVAWPERFKPGEISAIQHAMNLREDIGDEAFFAEYQNEPIDADEVTEAIISASEVAERVNRLDRGVVPLSAEHLTAFIDVHDSVLFYVVAAWSSDFTGAIIEYGTYPDQKTETFSTRKLRRTLAQCTPRAGREAAIAAGLASLGDGLLSREWRREDHSTMRIDRLLIDAGYETDLVYEHARRSVYAATILASKGLGIGATTRPMDEWAKKPGERMGWHWIIGRGRDRASRLLRFDANHWKTFVHARLGIPIGDAGSLTLFGRSERTHQLFADHLVSELPTRVSAKGRTVQEWKMRTGHTDNHWLDCVVGCAVAASVVGVSLPEVGARKKIGTRQRITFAEARARRSARS